MKKFHKIFLRVAGIILVILCSIPLFIPWLFIDPVEIINKSFEK